jgi:hypothetical protein
MEPKNRITAEQALQHPYFEGLRNIWSSGKTHTTATTITSSGKGITQTAKSGGGYIKDDAQSEQNQETIEGGKSRKFDETLYKKIVQSLEKHGDPQHGEEGGHPGERSPGDRAKGNPGTKKHQAQLASTYVAPLKNMGEVRSSEQFPQAGALGSSRAAVEMPLVQGSRLGVLGKPAQVLAHPFDISLDSRWRSIKSLSINLSREME